MSGEPVGTNPERGVPEEALRAAFGSEEESGASVLRWIERLSGVRSRVLLADDPDEHSPLLKIRTFEEDQGVADDSRYHVVGEIARGGVGVVYKARDMDLGRDVALKVLRGSQAHLPEIFERFVEEAQIGGQLQHPGIVPVYSLGLQPDGRPFFAMKLVKGKTLAAALKEREEPGVDRRLLLRAFERVCQTIAYAHARGVIHRDLKPSNVMLGAFGEVLVVDWGFGKVLGRQEPARVEAERTVVTTVRSEHEGSTSVAGSVMGTPAYMPPEQALGHVEELDEQTDVFALGAMLTEILTGKPPYVGEARDLLVMAAQARLEGAHARLEACGADRALRDVARRCLAPLRADRPANAGEVAAAIGRHLTEAEERAHRSELDAVRQQVRSEQARAHAQAARRGKRLSLAAAAAVLLSVAAGGGAFAWQDARARAREEAARPRAERAMEEAARLGGEGRWEEALAAARKAAAIAEDAGGATRERAREAVARAEDGGRAAEAEARRRAEEEVLVARLEEARLRRADLEVSRQFEETDDAYAEAFLAHGIDVADAERSAEAIRSRFPSIAGELAAALDDWAWLRRRYGKDAARDPEALSRIAGLVDPDEWRGRLRSAATAGDLEALRALAAEAREKELPARTLDLLGLALGEAGDVAAAIEHLRLATLEHPGDLWLQFHLGFEALRAEPPQPQLAVRHLTAAIALRPRSPWIWATRGSAHGSAGRHDAAIEDDLEALRLDPGDWRVLADLANQYAAARRFPEAIEAGERALGIAPGSAPLRSNLGNALRALGRLDEAIEAYREAIPLDPSLALVHRNLGRALTEAKQREEALAAFREALRLDGGDPETHRDLAGVLWLQADRDGALRHAEEAVRLAPRCAAYREFLGSLHLQAGRLEDAERELREAIALDLGCASALKHLGVLRMNRGRHAEALGPLREAVRLDPGDAAAHANLAQALAVLGKHDEAEREARRALDLDPRGFLAHEALGRALLGRGRAAEAVEVVREGVRVLASAPPEPGLAARWVGLGALLRMAGRPEEAIAACREGIRLDPRSADAHALLGDLLPHLGRPEEAVEAYRKALEIDPADDRTRGNLGGLLGGLGRDEEAARELREAARLAPDVAGHHVNLGLLLAGRGEHEEAAREFRAAMKRDPRLLLAYRGLAVSLAQRGEFRQAVAILRLAGQRPPSPGAPGVSYPPVDPAELAATAAWFERLAEARERADDFLAGQWAPRDRDGTMALGWVLQAQTQKDLPVAAAELFRGLFAEDPSAARGRTPGGSNLRNPICAAARAGTGSGQDAADLADAERATWRGTALRWLRDLLAEAREEADPAAAAVARQSLAEFLVDDDLRGLRDEPGLSALPPAEREAWASLWAEIRALAAPPAGEGSRR